MATTYKTVGGQLTAVFDDGSSAEAAWLVDPATGVAAGVTVPGGAKYAKISASASGNNTLVAAVTDKKIRVLQYNFVVAGAVNVKFQSAAGGTDISGLKTFAAAGGGMGAGYSPVGWFETAAGALLNLSLSGAVLVGGELVYIEV